MSLKPLFDRVVIKDAEMEETTKGGLILTSGAKEKPQYAYVVAVGPGRRGGRQGHHHAGERRPEGGLFQVCRHGNQDRRRGIQDRPSERHSRHR